MLVRVATALVKKPRVIPNNKGKSYHLRTPRQRTIDLAKKELGVAKEHHAKAKARMVNCPHKRALEKAENAIRDAENVLAALGVESAPKPTMAAAGIQPRFDKCPNCGRSKVASESRCRICQQVRDRA